MLQWGRDPGHGKDGGDDGHVVQTDALPLVEPAQYPRCPPLPLPHADWGTREERTMGRHYTDHEYLSLLEDRGPDTATGIATHLHRDRTKIEKRMKRLAQTGHAYHRGKGVKGDPRIWYSINDPYGGM